MSYSRLIHDYLDSGLDGSTEEVLFSELARNTRLRNEFNQQMKIHLIAKEDFSRISPPAAVTNAVFAGLGFSMPTSVYYSSQIDGDLDKTTIKRFVKRNVAWLLLLLLSFSAIPFAYYYNFNSNDYTKYTGKNWNNPSSRSSIPIVSSIEEKSSKSIDDNNSISVGNDTKSRNSLASGLRNKSTENTNPAYNNSLKARNSISASSDLNIKDADMNDSKDKSDVALNSDDDKSLKYINPAHFDGQMNISNTNNLQKGMNKSKVPNKFINNSILVNSISELIALIDSDFLRLSDSKYQINLRAISPTSNYPDINFVNQNEFYNNLAISGMYNFNDNHSLGFEFGNERFNQEFTYRNNGLNYIQSPIIYYVGASYKFNARNLILENYFYPYAVVIAGATNIGPIMKTQVGFNWDISMPIHLQIGMEYGILYYSVDNNTYNSQKLGFTVGMNYNW